MFNADDVEQDLRRLLRDEAKLLNFDRKALANSFASMAGLIDYLKVCR
jgi:transcriptional regulator CtsR